MASELPNNALGKLASSVKNIVTGVPLEDNDVDMQETKVDKTVSKSAGKTKTLDKTVDKSVDKTVEVDDHATVHKEKTAPVVHEDVKSHEHEKVDTEVDHEIHQDHYHTTIQPVKDKNVLPTKHVYQENEAEREIDHRDDKAKKAAEAEAARIRNEKVVEGTTHSKEIAPTHENQHIHHHIHETIQPVIERETVQQKVVHTTNHIHETEHLKDQHHEATVAPAISMNDFKKDTGAAAVTEDIEFPVSEVNKGVAVHAKKREVAQANVDAEDTKVGKSAKLMDS